jgi:hypothetical protein
VPAGSVICKEARRDVNPEDGGTMTRKTKALGLALLAVAALSALVISTASGEELNKRFRSETEFTIITGEPVSPTILTTSAGELKCGNAHLRGTFIEKEAIETTFTPTYENCTLDGLKTDVNFTECTFRFGLVEGTTKTEGGGTHTNGPFHIDCPTGKKIEAEATFLGKALCTITIPAQSPGVGEYALKNFGAGKTRDDLYTSEIGNIFYEVDGNPEICGDNEMDGILDGSFTMKGYEDQENEPKGQVGIWIG